MTRSTTSRAVTPEDFGRFADISGVGLSFDAGLVSAVVSVPDLAANSYRTELVWGPVDGPLRSVEIGRDGRVGLTQWSPVDRRLAVVVHGPTGDSVEIRSYDEEAATVVLSGWPDAIEELSFSPDGSTLLFVVREPVDRAYWLIPEAARPPLRLRELRYREDGIGWLAGRPRQAYLLPVTGGKPTKLSAGAHDDAEFSWHPDGQSVFFVSQRQAGRDRSPRNEVYRQPVTGGEPTRLTETGWCYGSPRCSPDGRTLAVTTVDVVGYPAATHLSTLALDTGELVDVTIDLDRDCNGPAARWLDDHTIATMVDDAGAIGVRRIPTTPAAGPISEILGGHRRITAFDQRSDTIAFVESAPTLPPRLVVRTGAGAERVVHAPSAGLADDRDLLVPQHQPVPVADGVLVDSWLTLPDSGQWPGPRPLMVWLQGGGGHFGHQFSHEVQALAANGYAVLYLNARGSGGYGTDWMRVVSGADAAVPGTGWGVDDIADVAAVVRAALDRNAGLDAGRVGVMGGSYGGLVVTHLLAQTDLFRAGWAERGPYNLFSDAGTKDEAPWFFQAYLGRSHLEDPAAYWAASPLARVETITAPLMIVHSEQDYRCEISQAEELFMALKLLDREVEFVRFPGEGHGLTRQGSPIHRAQRLDLLLEWFGRWLAPGTRSAAD